MFFGDKVEDTRSVFFLSWKKFRQQQALTPLEQQVVAVISHHPEYHAFFDTFGLGQAKQSDLEPKENPFLHLGLHLALRDQVATNRPVGIREIFQQLVVRDVDHLAVEHQMMEVLASCLWQAQQAGTFPERDYLQLLNQLLHT